MDVRYALRTLRRAPAFAITAILILALGIGATTALFGAVKQLLLDDLQVHAPEQLARLRWAGVNPSALVAIGAIAGVAAALAAGRLIESFLFGLTPADVSTHILAVALIGVVATLAAWLPARRAARVDPMVALRCE